MNNRYSTVQPKFSHGNIHKRRIYIDNMISIICLISVFAVSCLVCRLAATLTFFFLSSAVSAETLQKNLELMGRHIKNLEKDLETFPPPQNDNDLFVEKMSISSSSTYCFCFFLMKNVFGKCFFKRISVLLNTKIQYEFYVP